MDSKFKFNDKAKNDFDEILIYTSNKHLKSTSL